MNMNRGYDSLCISLCAAEAPESVQLIQTLSTEKIVDRMKNRTGMRLDRYLVLRTKCVKVERSHNCGDRCAGCLMATDLPTIPAFAHMVCVGDGSGRKPEKERFESFKRNDTYDICRRSFGFIFKIHV